MDILGFDRKRVIITGEHIVYFLMCFMNDSLSNGTFLDVLPPGVRILNSCKMRSRFYLYHNKR